MTGTYGCSVKCVNLFNAARNRQLHIQTNPLTTSEYTEDIAVPWIFQQCTEDIAFSIFPIYSLAKDNIEWFLVGIIVLHYNP